MFKTNDENIRDILAKVASGNIQLPEFQRGWVWNDDSIQDLLTSIISSFPIGAVISLERGGDVSFKNRPLQGVRLRAPIRLPDSWLLDGQQRLTSMYQSLGCQDPVLTKEKSRDATRFYYVDIPAALKKRPGQSNPVISVPEEKMIFADLGRVIRLDLSTRSLEFENHMIPTGLLLNFNDYQYEYIEHWSGRDDYPYGQPIELVKLFYNEIIEPLTRYQIPVIQLNKNVPRQAVCAVFEKVNTGGVKLNVFELLTAMLAADEFDLRSDWDKRREAMHEYDVLKAVSNDRFLQALCLAVTLHRARRQRSCSTNPEAPLEGVGCQRRDILSLSTEDYSKWAPETQKGFVWAAEFLADLHVFTARDLPYAAQVVSLAALFVEMGDELNDQNTRNLLKQWFWSGVFGEDYGSSPATRIAQDVLHVPSYLRSGRRPEMLDLANFEPQRLVSLRTRQSAAYKGLHALLLSQGIVDWRSGSSINVATCFGRNVDIHHIFPKAWCEQHSKAKFNVKIPPRIYNSAINKAPLSANTNQMIGSKPPSRYLESLRKQNQEINHAVQLCLSDVESLEADDFAGFFVQRGVALTKLIFTAMGKGEPPTDCKQTFGNVLSQENLAFESDEYDDSIPDEPDIILTVD